MLAACMHAFVPHPPPSNVAEMLPYQATGMNPYDMRVKCAVPPL